MINYLRHLFLPRETNNYRPKILHHKYLLILTLLFFSAGILTSFIKTNYPSVLGTFSNISQDALLTTTNQKRQEAGLTPLSLNSQLSQAAAGKASDMFSKNYWAHVSPDGTTPWVFIKDAGYSYIYAGENLARGFTTPADVVNAWMASPSHRENMLSPKYNDVGFAIETGKLSGEDTVLVVEMLGSTSFATKSVNDVENQKPVQVAVASGSPSTVNTNNSNSKPETLVLQKTTTTNKKSVANLQNQQAQPLVNGASVSILTARIVISLFIFILLLDMIIIERKKILRFVGHNLDHVIFLSLLLLIIFILTRGVVL